MESNRGIFDTKIKTYKQNIERADDTYEAVSFIETDEVSRTTNGGDASLRTNKAFKGQFHHKNR